MGVWRFFCSVRLALILILVLTGMSIFGALVMQVPMDVKADPSQYGWWLDNPARDRFGLWAKPMAFLGLFDVFHSVWFYAAGFLLLANICICTLNRWRGVWHSIASFRPRLPERTYETGPNRLSFSGLPLSLSQAEGVVRRLLGRRRYRVLVENSPEWVYLGADKNRHFRLGTYLVHFSLILFVLSYFIGSMAGFDLNTFAVPEGSVREVGQGTNLALKVESFVDEYWPEGPPKDYRSEVVLYEDGQEVKRGTIRVNHYLSYKGVKFYQSFFGPALEMEVKDALDRTLFNDGVALVWQSGRKPLQRPMGNFPLPGTNLTAWVVAPAQGYFDPEIKAGQVVLEVYPRGSRTPVALEVLDQGQPTRLVGYTFTFLREKQYSGFSVSRDPGNLLIWLSSGLFVLGIALVFYFPHRQFWALCRQDGQGGTEVVLRTTSSRSFAITSELESLKEELEEALKKG